MAIPTRRADMEGLERIDNLTLPQNGLLHIECELSQGSPSYWRIAREAHLVLARSMIEVLRGTNDILITGRSNKHEWVYGPRRGASQRIHPVSVEGCTTAWRFSDPEPCDEPTAVMSAGATKPIAGARGLRRGSNRLIGFYDALAMIQAECFMNQWYSGGPVPVSDEDMQTLQWLHECVRNEYEHFVPKFFHAPRSSLAGAGTLCLHLASALLYNKHPVGRDGFAGLSSRIWTSENVDQRALKARFEQLITALDAAPVARPTAE